MTTKQFNHSDNRPRTVRGASWFNLHTPIMGSDSKPMFSVSNIGCRLTQTGCRQQILGSVTPP